MVPGTPPKASWGLLRVHLECPGVLVGFANVVRRSLGDSGGHASGPKLGTHSVFRGHPQLIFK